MGYIKVISDGYILGIGENPRMNGNITEKEYADLITVFNKKPEDKDGYILKLNEKDLKWEYIKKPDDPDTGKESITHDEAWKIIESSNISKENKQKLYDYIYGKGGA